MKHIVQDAILDMKHYWLLLYVLIILYYIGQWTLFLNIYCYSSHQGLQSLLTISTLLSQPREPLNHISGTAIFSWIFDRYIILEYINIEYKTWNLKKVTANFNSRICLLWWKTKKICRKLEISNYKHSYLSI